MDTEIWKPVKNFEDRYEVSDYGQVRSLRHQGRKRILYMSISNDIYGYPKVQLYKKGKSTSIKVHKLVLEAFVGPCPEDKHCCNHKDGNKENNHVTNLEWVTQKENMTHSREVLGNTYYRFPKGKAPNTKLRPDDVLQIRKSLENGEKPLRLAVKYDVTEVTIHNIWKRRTWKDI